MINLVVNFVTKKIENQVGTIILKWGHHHNQNIREQYSIQNKIKFN